MRRLFKNTYIIYAYSGEVFIGSKRVQAWNRNECQDMSAELFPGADQFIVHELG